MPTINQTLARTWSRALAGRTCTVWRACIRVWTFGVRRGIKCIGWSAHLHHDCARTFARLVVGSGEPAPCSCEVTGERVSPSAYRRASADRPSHHHRPAAPTSIPYMSLYPPLHGPVPATVRTTTDGLHQVMGPQTVIPECPGIYIYLQGRHARRRVAKVAAAGPPLSSAAPFA